METSTEFVKNLNIHPEYQSSLAELLQAWEFKTWVDILVVVDTEIATQKGVGFGIGSVIELIRNAKVGCMRFRVDIALRNGEAPSVVAAPAPGAPKYRGFRFNMANGGVDVLDKYEQVWCFGFKPSNSGSTSDAEIDQAGAFPASNAELAKLAKWMDERKGGLFGTGDHHFLGASMCRKIPRLGTMRRWTNAGGVPPIGTPARIDTLRPPSPAYLPGAPGGPLDMNNSPHQGDIKPQPIRWVTWQTSQWPFFWKKRPHPVLCHPTLGPINVMPDHAHEGLCIDTGSVPLGGTFNFDGAGSKPEYPPAIAGGAQPEPRIIAYGSTLGDPPYNFGKGPQPARPSFPMISVYDGHQAGVGRVATDTTWHHWFDVNIETLQAADNDDWKKISRYFINLAVWLNPPGFSTNCLYLSALASHFEYPGFEEYHPTRPTRELGAELRLHLAKIYGPCWVTERVFWDIILYKKLLPFEILRELEPRFDFGGILPEVIEDTILGHFVEATMQPALSVKQAVSEGHVANAKTAVLPARIAQPDDLFLRGVDKALDELTGELSAQFEEGAKFVSALRR